MAKERKKGSGGVRINAGRKKKYKEPSIDFRKRIPKSLFARITEIVNIEVKDFEVLNNKKQNENDSN
jgi:hypothetical protein